MANIIVRYQKANREDFTIVKILQGTMTRMGSKENEKLNLPMTALFLTV